MKKTLVYLAVAFGIIISGQAFADPAGRDAAEFGCMVAMIHPEYLHQPAPFSGDLLEKGVGETGIYREQHGNQEIYHWKKEGRAGQSNNGFGKCIQYSRDFEKLNEYRLKYTFVKIDTSGEYLFKFHLVGK